MVTRKLSVCYLEKLFMPRSIMRLQQFSYTLYLWLTYSIQNELIVFYFFSNRRPQAKLLSGCLGDYSNYIAKSVFHCQIFLLQVVIFVKSVQRCMALSQLLTEQNFPAVAIHRGMIQEERLKKYQEFKDFQKVSRWFSLNYPLDSPHKWPDTKSSIARIVQQILCS